MQQDVRVELVDVQGRIVDVQTVFAGSTMAYFDIRKRYAGNYWLRYFSTAGNYTEPVVILRD